MAIIAFLYFSVFAEISTGAVLQETKTNHLPQGIVKEKPTAGRFVKTDAGYMVPYATKIPGTDIEFHMVPIPGGTFKMGSPESESERRDDEGPQFKVRVEPFWMGKYEVTWAEYQQFMALDRHFRAFKHANVRVLKDVNQIDAITAPSSFYDPSFPYEAGEEPNEPAATMTQYAAKQYTKWLSLLGAGFHRLPTEAEWEYACRAGTTTAFYFGDDVDELEDYAWFYDNSEEMRHAVGQKKPNPWGLYDMYGNVAEWVLDQYDDKHYQKNLGKTLSSLDAMRIPDEVYPRVLRGGSFELEAVDCRSAARLGADDEECKDRDPNHPQSPWWYTDTPGLGTGIRIIRPLKSPSSALAKEKFWKADMPDILADAKNRIRENGKGFYGIVDPQLPKAISDIKAEDR